MTFAELYVEPDLGKVSTYLAYLPAIFQAEDQTEGAGLFLGRFLRAFEYVVSHLDQEIGALHTYLDPDLAPAEFLPWLAGWVAFTLDQEWSEDVKRRFIRQMPALYRLRGTPAGMEGLLREYIDISTEVDQKGSAVQVEDGGKPMQIGVVAKLGEDTLLGGSRPNQFTVRLQLTILNPTRLEREKRLVRAIVEREKPAHTTYRLEVSVPTMQLGRTSTLGVNTLLGNLIRAQGVTT